MVAKVTIRKLETSEDWRYKGCACKGKLVQMENGNYQCRKEKENAECEMDSFH